jgi:hypothetical protein
VSKVTEKIKTHTSVWKKILSYIFSYKSLFFHHLKVAFGDSVKTNPKSIESNKNAFFFNSNFKFSLTMTSSFVSLVESSQPSYVYVHITLH